MVASDHVGITVDCGVVEVATDESAVDLGDCRTCTSSNDSDLPSTATACIAEGPLKILVTLTLASALKACGVVRFSLLTGSIEDQDMESSRLDPL